MQKLKFPAPYFGGKSMAAPIVWRALGQPKHYLEPFFGSGAVLLGRPDFDPTRHVETVSDADGYLCNVWRALRWAPDQVAEWCDWPVNQVDLAARRRALLREDGLLELLAEDDRFFDPRLAGYWLWCASCWIGSGMLTSSCASNKIPHLADSGKDVHSIALAKVAPSDSFYRPELAARFRRIAERIRGVRVTCGDWTKICRGNWQAAKAQFKTCGVFLDPPYSDGQRRLYAVDSDTISAEVRAWALERGAREGYRIVLAGYYEEHAELLDHGWRAKRWKGKGGYGNQGEENANAMRETLFLSPHCEEVDDGTN